MFKKSILTVATYFALTVSNANAAICACFYLEFPEDAGLSIMENYGELIAEVTAYSFVIAPYSWGMDAAMYEVESKHESSVKNINMGTLENRESMRLTAKGVEQRILRKNIECQNTDIQLAQARSEVMYLEQLMLEIAIDSNVIIGKEKKMVIGY